MTENKCNVNENDIKNSEENNEDIENAFLLKENDTKITASSNMLPNISKKGDKEITLDFVVYEIFGESKIKNYEKVISEIKKVEQKTEKEKLQLKKKINQMSKKLSSFNTANSIEIDDEEKKNFERMMNLQIRRLEMMEYEKNRKLNFVDIAMKVKIPPEKRTIRDILRIKSYIDQSRLGITFKEEFSDKNVAEKLIYFLSIEMKYKKFKKGEMIFRIGEHPDAFYSIIFGKANILKPMPKTVFLSGYQYFSYLMKLRKDKEFYIYNLCIEHNKKNFVIEEEHREIIHYVYLLSYLEYIRTNSDPNIDFEQILDLLNLNPEDLQLDPQKVNDNYYINDHIKNIIKILPQISADTIEKYSFINDNFLKKEVIIYEYKKFLELRSNDYFGDSAIETNTPRNATIIAEEDTDMAYLTSKLYMAQIASEKAIVLGNKISALHSSYFFCKVKYHKFAKNYYNWFLNEVYIKNDVLFYEGEDIKYLYFIQEGNVELTSSKSMNEIESLISELKEKKEDIIEKHIVANAHTKQKQNQNNDDYFTYTQINSDPDDFFHYLNEKQKNKLLILNKNEDLGIISFLMGKKYITTCTVISRFAKIYKLDVDYLSQMLESEIDCRREFYKRMKNKLSLLSERLFKINDINLIKTDEKINKIKLLKKLEYEKQVLESNSSKNKTVINYDKINEILNIQTDNNSSRINNDSASNVDAINTSNHKNRVKNDSFNLPLLSNNKYFMKFSLPSLKNISEIPKKPMNPIRLKMLKKEGLQFDNVTKSEAMNQNQRHIIISSKKCLVEDNMLQKVKREMKAFSLNKYTLSKDEVKLGHGRSNSNSSIKLISDTSKNNNNNNSQLYLTQIPENNAASDIDLLNSLINPSEKDTKDTSNNNNSNNHNIVNRCSSLPSHVTKKMTNLSLDKCMTVENGLDNINNFHSRFKFNDNNKLANENIKGNKSIDLLQKNNIKLYKKYDHPYYTPSTLFKKERYKIFEENVFAKLQSEYLNTQIERVKELKRLRAAFKNSFKFKLRTYNKTDSNK